MFSSGFHLHGRCTLVGLASFAHCAVVVLMLASQSNASDLFLRSSSRTRFVSVSDHKQPEPPSAKKRNKSKFWLSDKSDLIVVDSEDNPEEPESASTSATKDPEPPLVRLLARPRSKRASHSTTDFEIDMPEITAPEPVKLLDTIVPDELHDPEECPECQAFLAAMRSDEGSSFDEVIAATHHANPQSHASLHDGLWFENDKLISATTIDIGLKLGDEPGQQRTPNNKAQEIQGDYQSGAYVGGGFVRPWELADYLWKAPSFYHRPLYFEQVNLERYGHFHKHWYVQSALSTAHFFATIPALPLEMWIDPPCERVYTLGHYRPGNCNPHQHHWRP